MLTTTCMDHLRRDLSTLPSKVLVGQRGKVTDQKCQVSPHKQALQELCKPFSLHQDVVFPRKSSVSKVPDKFPFA